MKDGCQDEIALRRPPRQNAGRPKKIPPSVPPRIPRVTRLLALAIKFEEIVKRGEVRDYAEIARAGCVSRARLTQIMNLLNLAPPLLDNIMLDPNQAAVVATPESRIRRITSLVHWQDQITVWEQLRNDPSCPGNSVAVDAENLATALRIGSMEKERSARRGVCIR